MRIGIDIDDTTFDKLKAAKENKIELFIEDSYDTCKELSEKIPFAPKSIWYEKNIPFYF